MGDYSLWAIWATTAYDKKCRKHCHFPDSKTV